MSVSPPTKKSPIQLLVWMAGAFIFLFFILPSIVISWSSRLVEPRTQREIVFTNIMAEGGWSGFKTECDSLISQARKSGQPWGNFFPVSYTNCRTISKLNPGSVYVCVFKNGEKPDLVDMTIFSGGPKATGKPLKQCYGLSYQQLTNSDRCFAADLFQQPGLFRFNKVSDSIFEFYYR